MKGNEDIGILADYIVDSIETEDFIYAVKHFFYYKTNRLLNKLIYWWDNI